MNHYDKLTLQFLYSSTISISTSNNQYQLQSITWNEHICGSMWYFIDTFQGLLHWHWKIILLPQYHCIKPEEDAYLISPEVVK